MLKQFFQNTDHLTCGNPECKYDGEWCYHFTDNDYKELELTGKNAKQLRSFIKYCREHPEERFYQCLRNWSEYEYIYGSDYSLEELVGPESHFLDDLFYKE